MAMDKVSIPKFVLSNKGTVRAFITVIYDNRLYLRDFRIIEGSDGLFVSYPSKKGWDKKYHVLFFFIDKQEKSDFEDMVMELYKEKVKEKEKIDG